VQWGNGISLFFTSSQWASPSITPDGDGGAVVAAFTIGGDVYGQRINASGVVQWTPGGVVVCNASHAQDQPTIISDGAGGAIVTWQDQRNEAASGYNDVYALRVGPGGMIPTGVRDTPASGLALTPNHPNPFSATTTIDLDLRVDADVSVDVFDVGGRLIRRLELGRVGAGPRRVDFDGLDADGRELPSGVYFYRVHANGTAGARKMVIAR
jgi:hypothetical protein